MSLFCICGSSSISPRCHAFASFNIMSLLPISLSKGFREVSCSFPRKLICSRYSRAISKMIGSVLTMVAPCDNRVRKVGLAFSAECGTRTMRVRGGFPIRTSISFAGILQKLSVKVSIRRLLTYADAVDRRRSGAAGDLNVFHRKLNMMRQSRLMRKQV